MITFAGFITGLMLAGIGFTMVWRGNKWREYVGNLSAIIQYPNAGWLTWGVLGAVLMIIGFLMAFGLIQGLLTLMLGGFISPKVS